MCHGIHHGSSVTIRGFVGSQFHVDLYVDLYCPMISPITTCMLYMVTFTINIPPMLAYIPYMDPMGNKEFHWYCGIDDMLGPWQIRKTWGGDTDIKWYKWIMDILQNVAWCRPDLHVRLMIMGVQLVDFSCKCVGECSYPVAIHGLTLLTVEGWQCRVEKGYIS
jgi:hypothetical protein